MKKRNLFAAGTAVLAIAFAAALWPARAVSPVSAVVPVSARTLIIDAGHGGEDGGAVSISGLPESQINLAIACKLEDILALYGVAPKMLRREDISLHDSSASTLRQKKVSDLHNRVAMIEKTGGAVLVSIHQNSYPQPSCRGATPFYAPTPGSRELAEHVQLKLSACLRESRCRLAKQIPDTVYLMNHITCPAVLLECGFLTNPEEEALLRQEEYQRKIAAALASAVLTVPSAPEHTKETLGA